MECLENYFDLGRRLGEGGDVRLCTRRTTGEQYACKTASKFNSSAVARLRTEMAMLEKLKGQPNIVRMEDYFEDAYHLHIVLELCTGGDLFEHVIRRRPPVRLSEPEAAQAFKAVLTAVSRCHLQGIAHRDIKMENILLPSPHSPYSDLKLADFGLSDDFACSSKHEFHDMVGSPIYMAPEVFARCYDERADIWSLGILLYILLSGRPPFHGDSVHQVHLSLLSGKLDLSTDPWPALSGTVKELIKGMLQRDPQQRTKLMDLLDNPWLQSLTISKYTTQDLLRVP